MPSLETLLGFLAVSIVITMAPGPDNLMVLGQSLARGRAAGFGFALGCALGCFTHTLWAVLGVSAAIAASPMAFFLLKMAGAAYLGWIGVQTLRHASTRRLGSIKGGANEPWPRYLRRGFIANAINPKVALFFLAFLPQFTSPAHGSPTLQMIMLGSVFALQTTLVFGAIAFAAGSVGRLLARTPAAAVWLDRGAGLLFIGLALRLVLDGAEFSLDAQGKES